MSIKTIRQILGNRPVHHVAPDTTLAAAARDMAEKGVGALVVMQDARLEGILSERDIVFRGVAQDMPVGETPVREIMTREPMRVQIDDAISDALAAKLGDAFRHLPVMDGDAVVGLLSYRDIPAEYVMLFERFREMSTARADEDT